MGNKTIYLLFTQTSSVLTNLIKLYTGAPFNHVSIAFDQQLKELYSFGRKEPNNPLIGGFVKEDIHSGLYADYETKCMIYSFTVTEEQYNKMRSKVLAFYKEKEKYRFNFIGLFGFFINYTVERPYAYFCSQFVSTILKEAKISITNKPPSLTSPEDIRALHFLKLEFEGDLSDFAKQNRATPVTNHPDFTSFRSADRKQYA